MVNRKIGEPGKMLKCPKCGWKWVWVGRADTKVAYCGNCGASVNLEKHTLFDLAPYLPSGTVAYWDGETRESYIDFYEDMLRRSGVKEGDTPNQHVNRLLKHVAAGGRPEDLLPKKEKKKGKKKESEDVAAAERKEGKGSGLQPKSDRTPGTSPLMRSQLDRLEGSEEIEIEEEDRMMSEVMEPEVSVQVDEDEPGPMEDVAEAVALKQRLEDETLKELDRRRKVPKKGYYDLSKMTGLKRLLAILKLVVGEPTASLIHNIISEGTVNHEDLKAVWFLLRENRVSVDKARMIFVAYYGIPPEDEIIDELERAWQERRKGRMKVDKERASMKEEEKETKRPSSPMDIQRELLRLASDPTIPPEELYSKMYELMAKMRAMKMAEHLRKQIEQSIMQELGGGQSQQQLRQDLGLGESQDGMVELEFRGQRIRVTMKDFMAIASNPKLARMFGLDEPQGAGGESGKDGEKVEWVDPDTGRVMRVSPETYAVLKALYEKKDREKMVKWVDPRSGQVMEVPESVLPMLIALQSKPREKSEREVELESKLREIEGRYNEAMNEFRMKQVAQEIGDSLGGHFGQMMRKMEEEIKDLRRQLEEERSRHKGTELDSVVEAISKLNQITGGAVTIGGTNPQIKGLDIEQKRVEGELGILQKEQELKQNVATKIIDTAQTLVDTVVRNRLREREGPPPDVGPVAPPPPPPPIVYDRGGGGVGESSGSSAGEMVEAAAGGEDDGRISTPYGDVYVEGGRQEFRRGE